MFLRCHRNGQEILSRLYCKPTDCHSYLEFNSFHTPHKKTQFHIHSFLELEETVLDGKTLFYMVCNCQPIDLPEINWFGTKKKYSIPRCNR